MLQLQRLVVLFLIMLSNLLQEWLQQLSKIKTINDLNLFKSAVLGKNGVLSIEMKKLAYLDDEQKKNLGNQLNTAKNTINEAILKKRQEIEKTDVEKSLTKEWLDVTLPCNNSQIGGIHIVSKSIRDIKNYYMSRGFLVVDGNEIDTDFFNFDALNIPKHHPARQACDTFYIKDFYDVLLRTQTSTAQIHTMIDIGVPVNMISIGKVYRSDDLDSTHSPMFHQIEGLVVDNNPISVGHMKNEIQKILAFFFNTEDKDIAMRLRPSYFPFTEPGVEIDCKYKKVDGKIVLTKDGDKWMEIAGAGMVHPNVYKACGLNDNLYGFAFGIGLERIIMLKYGITDIRTIYCC